MSLEHIKQLTRNIEMLRSLQYSSTASARYDMLSDALIWEDELPRKLPFADIGFLRHVWRFRIELLEAGGTITDECWTMMRSMCPSWPGFRPERCENPEIVEQFKQLKHSSQQIPLPES